jgi:hypothetical protein
MIYRKVPFQQTINFMVKSSLNLSAGTDFYRDRANRFCCNLLLSLSQRIWRVTNPSTSINNLVLRLRVKAGIRSLLCSHPNSSKITWTNIFLQDYLSKLLCRRTIFKFLQDFCTNLNRSCICSVFYLVYVLGIN